MKNTASSRQVKPSDFARVAAMDAAALEACAAAMTKLGTVFAPLEERALVGHPRVYYGDEKPVHQADKPIREAMTLLRQAIALVLDGPTADVEEPVDPNAALPPRRSPGGVSAMGLGGRGVRAKVATPAPAMAIVPQTSAKARLKITLAALPEAAIREVVEAFTHPLSGQLSDHATLRPAWRALGKQARAEARKVWVDGMAPLIVTSLAHVAHAQQLTQGDLRDDKALGVGASLASTWFGDWVQTHPILGVAWKGVAIAERNELLAWVSGGVGDAMVRRLWQSGTPG